MSFVLPKAAQTRKLNSLHGDYRKIAEELIKNKFKEEDKCTSNKTNFHNHNMHAQNMYCYDAREKRLRINFCAKTPENVLTAIKTLENSNYRSNTFKLYVTMNDMQYLRVCPELWGSTNNGAYAVIFGISVYIIDGNNSYIEGSY